MYKTIYAGASGLFSIIFTAILVNPDWRWIIGFLIILMTLIIRGRMGEITKKLENMLFWLVITFSVIVLIDIIIY